MYPLSMKRVHSECVRRPVDGAEGTRNPSDFVWYSEYCENLCRSINTKMVSTIQPTKILTLHGSGYVVPDHLETASAFREGCYEAAVYSDIEYLKFRVVLRSYDPKKRHKEPIQLHFWFGYFQAMPPSEPISASESVH